MSSSGVEFNFRINELAPIARLLRGHFTDDQADFVDLLPKEYGKDFLPDLDQRLKAVERP